MYVNHADVNFEARHRLAWLLHQHIDYTKTPKADMVPSLALDTS